MTLRRRTILTATLVAALAAAAPLHAARGQAAAAGAVPVLGATFFESVGYGHAHPKRLSSGATAATFLVIDIRWKNWGAKESVGLGKGLYVSPGQPISAGRLLTKKLVAYDLGVCKGKRAYRKLDWWFPTRTKRTPSVIGPDGKAASICH